MGIDYVTKVQRQDVHAINLERDGDYTIAVTRLDHDGRDACHVEISYIFTDEVIVARADIRPADFANSNRVSCTIYAEAGSTVMICLQRRKPWCYRLLGDAIATLLVLIMVMSILIMLTTSIRDAVAFIGALLFLLSCFMAPVR